MERKVLEIEVKEVFDKYAIRIAYQDENILKRGEFIDDLLGVYSVGYPAFHNSRYDDALWIKGADKSRDDDILIVTEKELEIVDNTIKAIVNKQQKINCSLYDHLSSFHPIHLLLILLTKYC